MSQLGCVTDTLNLNSLNWPPGLSIQSSFSISSIRLEMAFLTVQPHGNPGISDQLRVLRGARGRSVLHKAPTVARVCLRREFWGHCSLTARPWTSYLNLKFYRLIISTRRTILLEPTLHRCFEDLTN